jgi:integrase
VAKKIELLSAVKVRNLKGPGVFSDGGNLYFRIAPGGTCSWTFRFAVQGKTRYMGLGAYPEISLADARELAMGCRKLLQEGIDPIEHRRAQRGTQRAAEAKALTFDDCVRGYINTHEAEWTNPRHRTQWAKTVADYVSPVFGKKPVAQVDQADVLKALEPIWRDKVETASRVRGRIEAVLSWAAAHGLRPSGDNPAQWTRLKHLLPKKSKVRPVENFAALPYSEIGAFVAALRESSDLAARCLEFTILTAVRTNEALGARWEEFEVNESGAWTWTIPGSRTKLGREHRVPLSAPAVAIVERLQDLRGDSDFVFPGARQGRPLTAGAMLTLIKRMGRGDITVHGFRSTFRDWAGEVTHHPNHVVEQALAHAIGSAVEAAYRRGDLFEKRRRLMTDWADYCAVVRTGEVVPFKKRRGRSDQG